MSQTVAIGKRARTDAQKEQRRRAILDAADSHLREAGFEAFSMAELGRLAGVAKGTLYLYFATREEVHLALYKEKLAAWESALNDAVGAQMSDRQFAAAIYRASYMDPVFLSLNSRLDNVIEHNVSEAELIELKRNMAATFDRLSRYLAPMLTLSPAQAMDALASLSALLLGVAQADLGPRIDRRKLPEDVRQFLALFTSEDIFLNNACRILAGIRSECG